MMYMPIVADYCKNLTEHTYRYCGQNAEFLVFSILVRTLTTSVQNIMTEDAKNVG